MNLNQTINKLYKENKLLVVHLFKFLGSSFIASVVDFSVYCLTLNYLKLQYFYGMLFGFFCGAMVSFLISNVFIFKRKDKVFKTLIKHYISGFSVFLFNFSVVALLIEFLNWNPLLAKILSIFVGFVFNFIFIKFLVFKDSRRTI